MIDNFLEIEGLIKSGKSLPHLNGFIQFATLLSIGIRTGQMEELPGTKDTIIAAVALQQLMNTKDGRKLLGIKAPNKVYNEAEFAINSPEYEIVRRMGCGEINRNDAMKELSNIFAIAQIYPDRKTLDRILSDLENKAKELRENLECMLRIAGWDGSDTSLSKTLLDMRGVNKQARN